MYRRARGDPGCRADASVPGGDAGGRPTFLNIDHAYPNQTFNVVIWGEQRRSFPLAGKPEVVMIGKQVCTKGLIEGYSNYTQIQDVGIDEVDILP